MNTFVFINRGTDYYQTYHQSDSLLIDVSYDINGEYHRDYLSAAELIGNNVEFTLHELLTEGGDNISTFIFVSIGNDYYQIYHPTGSPLIDVSYDIDGVHYQESLFALDFIDNDFETTLHNLLTKGGDRI